MAERARLPAVYAMSGWPMGSNHTAATIRTEVDRRLTEHVELCAMVKRLAFLLNSTRMVIGDQDARNIAGSAVADAERLLAKVRAR